MRFRLFTFTVFVLAFLWLMPTLGSAHDSTTAPISKGQWSSRWSTASTALYAPSNKAASTSHSSEVKFMASDGSENDIFGYSVALSGDVALVGAYGDNESSGSAYVYRWDGTSWQEEQKITASDGNEYDRFGSSVALSGDVALVGAPDDDSSGSAYLFRWNGNEWQEEQKITASDGASSDKFGNSVSLAGEVALVGAYGDDGISGSAYIFRKNGNEWVQEAKLTATDGAAYDFFGLSVSLAGEVALVGALGDDDNGRNSGSAYLFRRDGNEWVQEAKLTANDGAVYDKFGYSVSLAGEVALVGNLGDDDHGTDSGSAYLFRWNGSSWQQEQKILASDGASHDGFGLSVSLAGDVLLVGTYGDNDLGSRSGSAYLFGWDGTSWQEEGKLLASDGAEGDDFGSAVSISDEMALVGAPWKYDSIKGSGVGAAYLYNLSPGNVPDIALSPTSIQPVVLLGTTLTDTLTIGNAGTEPLTWTISADALWISAAPISGTVAPSGQQTVTLDFDATNLVLGSYTSTLTITSNDPDESSISLPTRITVIPPETKLLPSDGAEYDEFGRALSVSGDVLLIGAAGDDSAYIFRWSPLEGGRGVSGESWQQEGKLLASDGAANDRFGGSVSVSGEAGTLPSDVALVGAYFDDDLGSQSGSAYIYRWNGESWQEEDKLLASDGASYDYFGYSVSVSGDVALVGSPYDDDNGTQSGSAYIFRWNGENWQQEGKLLANDGNIQDQFGQSVSISGNLALVGADGDDDNGQYSGAAYLFRWNGNEWLLEQKLLASDGAEYDYFGQSVSISGSRALVGAWGDDDNGEFSGAVYIFQWNGESWQETKLTASDGTEYDGFGRSVSISGEVALVGALGGVTPDSESGWAYLFRWDGNSWQEESRLAASDTRSEDVFGYSVSISGDLALVGAYGDDDNGWHSGSAYLYELPFGSAPDIDLSPMSFSVTLVEGESISETLTIGNSGSETLTWSISADADWLTVMPISGTLAPTDTETLSVTLDASLLTAGSYTGTLTITTNDPDESSVALPVLLTVTSPSTPTPTPTATGTVTSTPTATGTVTSTPTATGSLTSTPIATGTATNRPTATGSVTSTPTVTGTITSTPTVTGTITSTPTATGTITSTPTATGSLTSTPIATGSLTSTPIATGTATSTPIATGSLTSTPTATGSLTSTPIATGSLTSTPIATGSLTSTPIATGTATNRPIATGTATNRPIATGTATNRPIATGTATNRPIVVVQVTIDPSSSGTLSSPDEMVQLNFPAGAVSETTVMTYTEQMTPSQSTGSFLFAGSSFDILARDANGNPVTEFSQPFTMSVTYQDADWQDAGIELLW